jgi:hypothetical protein
MPSHLKVNFDVAIQPSFAVATAILSNDQGDIIAAYAKKLPDVVGCKHWRSISSPAGNESSSVKLFVILTGIITPMIDDPRLGIYGVYFGSCIISWCGKKQLVVSRSSTEVEYCALAMATAEIY